MESETHSEFEMKKGIVSVVVPVYNVEKYLDRCMISIVNQTYHNLEIILIDDGSTDSSSCKCDEWAVRDSRIKVIHKENAGAGMARNTGIDHAAGEYICFFDSDDYVALDAIEKAYHWISHYKADIVHFGCYNIDLDGRVKNRDIPETDKILYQGDEILKYILPNMIGADLKTGKKRLLAMVPWRCMYSMTTIRRNHWRFVSEKEYISEDAYSQLLLYKNVTRVAVLPEALYYYCENRTSLTHVYIENKYERIKTWYEACLRVCDEFGYGEEVTGRMPDRFVNMTIRTIKTIAHADGDKREKREEINTILQDRKFYEIVSDINIKYQTKQQKALLFAIKYRLYRIAWLMVRLKI
ncbi:glycosyltransferase, group 2 family protein [Marvinbryantia formatexigens DSM 14469]|uniref:Glycosyltransferase, group 2 family protein n=1 Tax=Marvinbryantia formatexigens DSM 14469 TaxID=478749 RepID=C6LDI0_9FIRM|nr:glycosyltransferase family A protein [Marvinbryantia formatexigens]EET61414.1 glycosyltransferase, group 2 family protein [Marvinbryantia formatexigens DSM 14469]UWO26084.1 glycosyltransferase family 2 protein [Marvinbryantia formatexigens DSM 14469]SDF90368.1 Glycosyl transferase family 2 [Marvinbryantia formatexigens]